MSGSLDLENLIRLQDVVMGDDSGSVDVELIFGKDQEGICFIKGTLKTELKLECQRCLNVIHFPIESEMMLSPVSDDTKAKRLPSRYEPLIVVQDKISLIEMIEDELLLNIPIVPKHPMDQCEV